MSGNDPDAAERLIDYALGLRWANLPEVTPMAARTFLRLVAQLADRRTIERAVDALLGAPDRPRARA